MAGRHATHDRRRAGAHRSLRLWPERLRARRRSRFRAAPDGGDPEGALPRREACRHGRADLIPDGARGRDVVRDGRPAQGLRHRHCLYQPSHGGRAAALGPHFDRQGRAPDRAAPAERDLDRPYRFADVALAGKPGQSAPIERVPVQRRTAAKAGAPALSVSGLKTARKLSDIAFDIWPGEIVGLAGLVGSGRSTLAKAIFGLIPDAPARSRSRGGRSDRQRLERGRGQDRLCPGGPQAGRPRCQPVAGGEFRADQS